MRFACVGFDVRLSASEGFYSADSAEWVRNETWYSKLVASGKATQNEYGLLSVKNQEALENICNDILASSESCDLAAVELPLEVMQFFDAKLGFRTSSNILSLSRFTCHGFDVCDINGLITLFNHPLIASYREGKGLIPEGEVTKALEAVQLANLVEADHRPSILAKVHSLRK